jgi:hypothetical protein
MQLANLTASCVSCCTWAWVGGPPEPDDLGEVEELEPQAASTIVAAIAAVTV